MRAGTSINLGYPYSRVAHAVTTVLRFRKRTLSLSVPIQHILITAQKRGLPSRSLSECGLVLVAILFYRSPIYTMWHWIEHKRRKTRALVHSISSPLPHHQSRTKEYPYRRPYDKLDQSDYLTTPQDYSHRETARRQCHGPDHKSLMIVRPAQRASR